ncbi:MAG: GNAT family N-acetyltransferase [Anaerolineae bacterium]
MRIRVFRWEDLPAIADVMNAFYTGFGIPINNPITVEQIESRWRVPYNHPDRDCFIAEDEDGRIIGFVIADLLDNPRRANGVYRVPAGNTEAGRLLMNAAHEHFRRVAARRGVSGEPLTMQWTIIDSADEVITLLEAEGCALVRSFYTMSINLPDTPLEPMPLPEGFERRPFVRDDVETVFAAYHDIFADHWGDQNTTLDEWRMDIEQPGFDPDLWWVIYAGDEIAGLLLCNTETEQAGWVSLLGVRRVWRKHGLASALLRQCFIEFQRRGRERVELGVDSDSPTNAVSLYKRAGMHVRQRILYYDKVLPPL